jgi:uroporphyrin-III C-methyltransferase
VAREFVGKRCGKHSMRQQDICEKVVNLAASGLTVVRLKGGDPALFARTCEETNALSAANIPFAIVPGITAASGMSAYTGIPLTDRRCSQAVSFITAHFSDPETWPDMQRLCTVMQHQSVVVYMGLSRLALLSERLQAAGLSAHWPVAAIENATCANQRLITGTLANLPNKVMQANLEGPTLLVFGKVVESKQNVSLSLLQSNNHVTAI